MNMVTTGKGTVVLKESAEAPLQGLKLIGRSSQTGTPSPTNPLWINNAGDSGAIGVTILKKQKNLCPVNDISFETSTQIRFGVTFPAGEYTISGVIKSTDTDVSQCLLLFYYEDGSTKEININRSIDDERVTATVVLTKPCSRMRIYAGESHATSSGDTATYNDFQIEEGSTASEFEPYIPPQTFAVSTPNALPGIPVETGGNYTDAEGRQWVGNIVDFATGKHTLLVNKEILVNTPNFTESPDHPGFFIWDNAVGNVYKDASNPCILSFAPYGTVDAECAYINGQQIAYRPATPMTAEEVNALFAKMQSASVPAYLIGQLTAPVESNLSNEQIEAFKQLHTYEPATIVGNDQDVWMEIEYEAVETEEAPEEPGEDLTYQEIEIISYYAALAKGLPVSATLYPTCREAHLLRKLLDPSYEVPFKSIDTISRTERYLWNLVNGTTDMLSNIPKSDKEKYLHVAIGGTVYEMPNPGVCLLNYWMYQWLKKLGKVE